MGLVDRFREAWEDLRSTRKEEQETASVEHSVADVLRQWAENRSTRQQGTVPEQTPRLYEELSPEEQKEHDNNLREENWEMGKMSPYELENERIAGGNSALEAEQLQWAKDYKAAVTPGESVEPVALDRGLAGNIATLALDSEPARLKRIENILDHGSTENAPTADRTGRQDLYDTAQDRTQTAPDWPKEAVESRSTTAQIAGWDEEHMRVSHAVGPKHSGEFSFEKENGDIFTYKHNQTENRIHLDSSGNFQDLQEGKEPIPTTRAEVLRSYQEPPPEVLATLTPEHREQWTRLEKEVGFKGADDFNHVATWGRIEVYQHNGEGNHKLISLDEKGQFYDMESKNVPVAISREDALRQVQVEPHFYTPAERSLREAFGNENTPDLLPASKSGNIQTYQYWPNDAPNISYVHLDSDGTFYNTDRQVISREAALSAINNGSAGYDKPMAPGASELTPALFQNGVPHNVTAETPMDRSKIQPIIQEQSISM